MVGLCHLCGVDAEVPPSGLRSPKSSGDYPIPQFPCNREHDAEHQSRLREMNWGALMIWKCEVREQNAPEKRLRALLED